MAAGNPEKTKYLDELEEARAHKTYQSSILVFIQDENIITHITNSDDTGTKLVAFLSVKQLQVVKTLIKLFPAVLNHWKPSC